MASAIEPNSSYYICYHKALAERYVYIYCQWWSLMHDLKNCILLVQAHNKAGSLGAWAPHFFKILKIKIRLIYLLVWKWYFYFFHKTERLSIISPIYESFYLCFGPPPHFSWSFSFRLYLLWSQLNAIQYSVVIAQHNKLLTTWDAGKKEKKLLNF